MDMLHGLLSNKWFWTVLVLVLLPVLGLWLGLRSHRPARPRRDELPAAESEALYEEGYFDEPAYARRQKGPREPAPEVFAEPPLLDAGLPDEEEIVLLEPEAAPPAEEPPPRAEPPAPPPPRRPRDLIVVFYIKSLSEEGLRGPDVLAAFEQAGLQYGEMRIFHHYGLDNEGMAGHKPVFSVANMMEPGTFDPEHMQDFASPGLALFMRLPGPLSGRVAFELMLNHAKRLAESLRAGLEDDTHQVLDTAKIGFLREGIEAFERERLSHA